MRNAIINSDVTEYDAAICIVFWFACLQNEAFFVTFHSIKSHIETRIVI